MGDLEPCPFCGGEAEFSLGKTGDGKDWHYIECSECGAMGPHVKYADHNIAIKDALAEAWNRRSAETKNALLREVAEMIDKRHRGDLPDHIKSEDGNAIRAMIKEDAPRRYMGQIMAECDCPRRQECEAAQKCLADAARALYDTLKKARVGEAYMSDADDGFDCVTLDGIFNLEAIR